MAITRQQRVKDALIKRFQGLPLDARLPSDRDLAAEFGVAYLTINRVMRALEYEGYIVRRAKRGTFLASRERPVGNAHDQAPGADGSVLVIHPNYFSYHYWTHVRRAEEAAVKSGLRLLEFKINPESEHRRVLAFAKEVPDLRGVLLLPVPDSLTPKALDALDALGVPVVLLSTLADLGRRKHLYCIDGDNFQLGRVSAEALLKAGHRRIAYIMNEPKPSPLIQKGMIAALRDHGLAAKDLVCLGAEGKAWQDSREAGYRLTTGLLDRQLATGAFIGSYTGAQGAMHALWERKLSAPGDLSLIIPSVDPAVESYSAPPLTTVGWDRTEETRLAFSAVLGTWTGKDHSVELPIQLTERHSIAPPGPPPSR